MCDKECKDNVTVQLTKIDGKLDGLIGTFEEFKKNTEEQKRDHEKRLRVVEQKKCVFHTDMSDSIQNLKTDVAVGRKEIVMLISGAAFVSALFVQFGGRILEALIS